MKKYCKCLIQKNAFDFMCKETCNFILKYKYTKQIYLIIYICFRFNQINTWMEVLMAVQLLSSEVDSITWVQLWTETVSMSHSTNTLGKGMNPTILSLSYG